VRVLLVRHARAGNRAAWSGDDRLRPLDTKGRRQADALADTLVEFSVARLLSSPYVRCVQTLEPAAARLGLPIVERDELADGAGDAVATLLAGLEGGVTALSTHRDVIAALLGSQRGCRKGGIWVLEVEGGLARPERYLDPPA
jgi:broad specificity phosphatase PhoE